jgi:hypothetical protein
MYKVTIDIKGCSRVEKTLDKATVKIWKPRK